jgi:PST family polysaccharide transporter
MALLICPIVILGIVAGLRYGPQGVAMGYSAAMVLLLVPLVAWATAGTAITFRAYWGAVRHPLLAGFIAGLAGWILQRRFTGNLAPLSLLILELTISFLVYAGILLFALNEKNFYLDLVRQILPQRQNSAAKT